MRIDIFKWIEKEFGIFLGFINYAETVVEGVSKKDGKLYKTTEIKVAIGIKDAKDVYLNPETHRRWKEEIGIVADLGCEGCRIKFDVDSTKRSGTPDAVDIARGIKPDDLVFRKSFTLTVNIYKRILLTEI